uniref:Uncharacterized protein n=1 Tax=Plectus sambesii TaxID=2011161 RepID=A0A914XUR4_9BILA
MEALKSIMEQESQRSTLFHQEEAARRLQLEQEIYRIGMLLQANKTEMAEIQMAMNNQCVEHARQTSLQSASNGEQKSSGGKRKRGASPNTPQNPYKRARDARKGEGSLEVNIEDTINQTIAQHVGSATRDGDDTVFGLVTVSNTSAPMEMISLVIDGGRQPSYQPANNVESDHQCESNNHRDRKEGDDDDDDEDDDDNADNDDEDDKHEDDDNHEDVSYYDNVEDVITNSMYSQVTSATSPLPSETSGRSFEQGSLVTPTMSQRSVVLAPLLMPTTVKSILPKPVLHAASWQTDCQQAYSEIPRQPIVIQQQHEQMNTPPPPPPPPPQPHNEQDLQSYLHDMEIEMSRVRQELAEMQNRNNQHGQDVQLVNVQQTTTSQACISQPEEVVNADNEDDDAIQDQESVANHRQRIFTRFITDPVTRKKLNPFAAPVYAAVYTPPSRDSDPSTAARKLAAVKKAIRRGNQILLKEFGYEAENLKTDLLNQSDLKDIGNAIDREIVLFKEVIHGKEYKFVLRTQLLHDDEVVLVRCLDGAIAHSRSMQFCLQLFNCPFCPAFYNDRYNQSRHVKDCKFKGGFLTNIDTRLQTIVYKTGRRLRLVRRSIDEELEAAGIRLVHPKNYFFHTQVLACDCETMLQPIKESDYFLASREHTQTAKNAISSHTLLMFGSYSNIKGLERFTCIERDFSDPHQMAVDILNHWYRVAAVAQDLERHKFEHYFNQIRKIQETINPNSPYFKMLDNLTKKLDAHCARLSIVFFNLAYDQHILLKAGVFAIMLERDRLEDPTSNIQFHMVKGRVISIKTKNFHILDLMSYLPARATLKSAYEKFFGKDEDMNKQIMPYQYLDKPEKLENTIDSLVLDDFNDDLHGVNALQEPAAKYQDMLE